MDNKSLYGITVVVTRPEHQAQGLCEKITKLGGSIISFPLLKIENLDNDPLVEEAKDIRLYQHLIFISRNAVDAAVRIWPELPEITREKSIYAIGATSGDILKSKGFKNVIPCPGKASSENLLQLKSLGKDHIQDQSILILRGCGGRGLLAQSLRERGAKVDYADIYKRIRPCYDKEQINQLWQKRTGLQFIILTSVEALENLVTIMQSEHSDDILNSPLVAISERVAERAKQYGFNKAILVAETTNDDGLISALLESLNEEKQ